MSRTPHDLWLEFCAVETSIDPTTPYQVWHFGNTPEMATALADLVLCGKKTATASSDEMNRIEPENAPKPDGFSVVTDFDKNPICVIRTVEIKNLPFLEVDAEFAANEGEGDLSLQYWRRVHQDYFTREAAQYGFNFDEHSSICCERFELLFPR